MADIFTRSTKKDPLKLAATRQVFCEAVEPFAIQECEFRAGIDEAICQLRPFPPGVEERGDAAGDDDPKKSRAPFREVAHGDRDAIAFFEPLRLKRVRDRQGRPGELFESDAFVAINDESLVFVQSTRGKGLPQGRRRVFPHASPDALDVAFLYLEQRTWTSECSMCVSER